MLEGGGCGVERVWWRVRVMGGEGRGSRERKWRGEGGRGSDGGGKEGWGAVGGEGAVGGGGGMEGGGSSVK